MKLQSPNPPDKPVLDLGTFQQLLAAAYTLQEQNCHLLLKEARLDFPPLLSEDSDDEKVRPIPPVSRQPLEMGTRLPGLPLGILEAEVSKRQGLKATHRKLARAVRDAASGSRDKMRGRRIARSNRLFWTVATLVAMTAVLTFMLFASVGRLSPLPAELALPSGISQQPVPFHKAEPMATAPARRSRVGQQPVVTDPQPTANPGPSEQTEVAEAPPLKGANPASAEKTIVSPRVRSAYENEADVVAQDTVVRYGTQSAARRPQAQKP